MAATRRDIPVKKNSAMSCGAELVQATAERPGAEASGWAAAWNVKEDELATEGRREAACVVPPEWGVPGSVVPTVDNRPSELNLISDGGEPFASVGVAEIEPAPAVAATGDRESAPQPSSWPVERPDLWTAEPPETVAGDRRLRSWERQAPNRRVDDGRRRQVVAFSHWAQQTGATLGATARALAMSPRTLSDWRRRCFQDQLHIPPRGRPCHAAQRERLRDVLSFLEHTGPATGLPTLRQRYPDVSRAVLAELLTDYRGAYRRKHVRLQAELHWLRPGSVWAMDFSHPPQLIDGCFRAIFSVRDLASHQQLFWLPVSDETAETAIDALHGLFFEHGPPLVLKCDNGPGFVAHDMKQFLDDHSVFPLYSPPYYPRYNGAIEKANRTHKETTEHLAEQAGRAGYWTSPDLHAARRQLNQLTRPSGHRGLTAETVWTDRDPLTLAERHTFLEHIERARKGECLTRDIDPQGPLPHNTQAEIDRLAAQVVLQSLSYLLVTRRRISPPKSR